jgi:hypothetical protein
MKKYSLLIIVLVSIIFSGFDHPKGWVKDGKVDHYEFKVVPGGHDGKNSVTIKSSSTTLQSHSAFIWQNSLPTNFLGHRVKMTAFLKCQNISDTAGLWFNVLHSPTQVLETDEHFLTGTTDWKKFQIVLDIPKGTSNLNYGAYISGTGQIWFSDISFVIVDKSIASTSKKSEQYVPLDGGPIDAKRMLLATQDAPTNLDFATTVKAG